MAGRIGDYALIGDCETAALVHRSGSIDWLCWPRFDSQACLAALLGDESNGCWKVAPARDACRRSRRYLPDTLILETRFETEEGSARVLDFMPLRGRASDLVRIVEGLEGEVEFESRLVLKFDYGRISPWMQAQDSHAVAVAGPHAVRLDWPDPLRASADEHGVRSRFKVAAGERRRFVLTYFASHETPPETVDADRALNETEAFWKDWVGRCVYRGPWGEAVTRSLITLKALTYRPTGGIIAAPTTSLPERRGGERNWDYRYCWLRDATFMLLSLMDAGYKEEAVAWRDWLLRAVAGEPSMVQPVYGLAGEHRLSEMEADWLPGFGGARPVRLGNRAFQQLQIDIFGEVIDALHQARQHGVGESEAAWRLQRALLEHLEGVWRRPDDGIWETRGGPERFTHSQVMAWVAFDRAVKTLEHGRGEGPLEHWRSLRDQIRLEIFAKAYDPDLGAFTRSFGSRAVDASTLLMPLVGFIRADDPRMLGTVSVIERELVKDGFVRRYDTTTCNDGLPPGEGYFLACSFWLIDNLVLQGRHAEAERRFEQLLSVRNDVGLLAEEFDPDAGEHLGNFPQALSHLSLVDTAENLAQAAGPARERGEQA